MPADSLWLLTIENNIGNLFPIREMIANAFPSSVLVTAISDTNQIELSIAGGPDVILLEAEMPGMDGLSVCRLLNSHMVNRELRMIGLKKENSELKMMLAKSQEIHVQKENPKR